MIADAFLYSTTPASWVLCKLRWGLWACNTKWAFYQIFSHDVEIALHLLTMGTLPVFPPLTSFPPDSKDYLYLQQLLRLTCRHGQTCRVRGYQSITCLGETGWCFLFTVTCRTSCGTPSHYACSHSCPLESDQPMETTVNLQLLLVPHLLLSLKPWLFQMTSILLQLGLLPWTTELYGLRLQLVTAALPALVPPAGHQVPHSLQSHKPHTALFLTIFSLMPINVPVFC